ncbi:MAG TPA: hypothetical protein VGV39_11770 [Mesorhizobium sp.]|jgi:hypothetical protein|uniref:hypothetical protein n=1 Tax=Mesorhizobium sp. TaxID=1871066 RepID=UPI002DDD4D04|nr:hypothetical protein [Mesorhizobium sp.]HEV2503747.1 hypothetical protein [Mesorhizobium sp.]
MPKVRHSWQVEPHGRLEKLDSGLLTVSAEIQMPLGHFPRRMTVVGLSGGRTAIWSCIPLGEPQMREIEALGEPAFLIVPGAGHRLDIKPWAVRYPGAKVVCPPGARAAVQELVKVDATTDIFNDHSVRMETVPGVAEKEAALLVFRDGGTTLIVNDILANVRHPHGIGAQILARLLGYGVSRPKMPYFGRWLFVKDAKAVGEAFRKWSLEANIARIIVSHGEIITDKPRDVLERVARDFNA